MRLLVTGRGTSGSWQIRGEQLGAELCATVRPLATVEDCRSADMVVAVKRMNLATLAAIRASGRPWVWDMLDAYPQPACSEWTRGESIVWAKREINLHQPTAVIWPNARMREDCDPGLPGIVLRHHHRPGIKVNPVRPEVKSVGYEGAAAYLGAWRGTIEAECHRRGWTFSVNPDHLASLDIVLAVRDSGGYAGRHWKSAVKLANAHGSGTPFIGQQEAGYLEAATGAEYWTEDQAGLRVCFDWLEAQSTREQVADRFRQRAYTVEAAAADLQGFLCGL